MICGVMMTLKITKFIRYASMKQCCTSFQIIYFTFQSVTDHYTFFCGNSTTTFSCAPFHWWYHINKHFHAQKII